MSVWQPAVPAPLQSADGNLLSIRITVEAFLLEDLLDALAEAPFPINPAIRHHETMEREGKPAPAASVEFPAWQSQVGELRRLLHARRLNVDLAVSSMLAEIAT